MYKYLKMSDMFEGLEQIEKVKKPRKKREMTAERKAQLKEQLKKGRQTALENRKKKALVKKIKKDEANTEIEEYIEKAHKKKKSTNNNEDLTKLTKNIVNELGKCTSLLDQVRKKTDEIRQLLSDNQKEFIGVKVVLERDFIIHIVVLSQMIADTVKLQKNLLRKIK